MNSIDNLLKFGEASACNPKMANATAKNADSFRNSIENIDFEATMAAPGGAVKFSGNGRVLVRHKLLQINASAVICWARQGR